jgi:hypothetical protein
MTNAENIKRLQAILKNVKEAKELSQAAHELGEFHITPVYHQLVSAEQTVAARLYQLDSFTQEEEGRKKQAALFEEEKKRKAAADKAAADKQAADQKAIAEAEGKRIERERVLRTGTAEERLNVRTIEELKLIAAGMSLTTPRKGNDGKTKKPLVANDATREVLIAAILKAEKSDGGQVDLDDEEEVSEEQLKGLPIEELNRIAAGLKLQGIKPDATKEQLVEAILKSKPAQ